MYSWWQSAHRPPGMPKHSRSLWSGSRKVASNRVLISSRVQAGQRSRPVDMPAMLRPAPFGPYDPSVPRTPRTAADPCYWTRRIVFAS